MVFRSGVGTQMLIVSNVPIVCGIGGCAQPAGLLEQSDVRCRDVWNVRLATIDCGNLALIEVESGGGKPRARQFDHERKAHVTQADDADVRGPRDQAVFQLRGQGSIFARLRRHFGGYYVTAPLETIEPADESPRR